MNILVTGAAGFIGFHLAKRFLDRGDEVLGIDNLNDYYDVSLKKARLEQLHASCVMRRASCATTYNSSIHDSRFTNHGGFTFLKIDISDRETMENLFREYQFDRVIHTAAQAGVRYSIENPHAYVQSNVVGFLNVLEGCRTQWTKRTPLLCKEGRGEVDRHLVYASSSSVYGSNNKLPFSVEDRCDHPISLYAATKRADELMAHTYSHLYGIPTTGLRFFTVYGPWGRPDMALFKFTKAILAGDPIDVYNEGKMKRDFTYIDDIVEGVVRVVDCESRVTSHESRLYNIGNHSPIELMDFIRIIEEALGKKAKLNFLPMQPGDVPATYADVSDLSCDVDFAPKTPIHEGIRRFAGWYRSFYSGNYKAQN